MPLAREQRIRLARVLSWARSNGWVRDCYPNTWRSRDGQAHVRYDTAGEELAVDRMTQTQDTLRCRVALVPVDSPEQALRVLAALGHIPTALSAGHRLHADLTEDDQARSAYEALMDDDHHFYMSTYCQHGQHENCKLTCKCCGAPCVCSGCLHPASDGPAAVDPHEHATGAACSDPWCTDKTTTAAVDCSDAFDGPASFVDAGQAVADLTDGRVTAELAAEVLSKLARAGLIVSVAYHDEATGGGQAGEAALMADVASILDGTDR